MGQSEGGESKEKSSREGPWEGGSLGPQDSSSPFTLDQINKTVSNEAAESWHHCHLSWEFQPARVHRINVQGRVDNPSQTAVNSS